MRFPRDVLSPGDKVVYRTGMHWVYLLSASVWTAVFISAGLVGDQYLQPYLPRTLPDWGLDLFFFYLYPMRQPLFLFSVFAAAVICFPCLIRYFTTTIILTKSYIFYKTGLFTVDIKEIDLEEIKAEAIHKGLLGHIFGYGDLEMDCRFIGDTTIHALNNPEKFLHEANMQRARNREHFLEDESALNNKGKAVIL